MYCRVCMGVKCRVNSVSQPVIQLCIEDLAKWQAVSIEWDNFSEIISQSVIPAHCQSERSVQIIALSFVHLIHHGDSPLINRSTVVLHREKFTLTF